MDTLPSRSSAIHVAEQLRELASALQDALLSTYGVIMLWSHYSGYQVLFDDVNGLYQMASDQLAMIYEVGMALNELSTHAQVSYSKQATQLCKWADTYRALIDNINPK